MYRPSLEDFKKLSLNGNMVPVCREIMADLETPVSAFMKLAGDDPHAFLLESVEQGEKLGRYSFIGFNPSRIFSVRGMNLIEEHDGSTTKHPLDKDHDPLFYLKQFEEQFNYVSLDDMPPFSGGLVGYLNYEMTRFFEDLPFENRDDFGIPDAVFFYVDAYVAFDHFQRTMLIVHNALIESTPEEAYQNAQNKIDSIVSQLKKPLPEVTFGQGKTDPVEVKTNWDKESFQNAVDISKEHIKAGDIYQIQVGIRSDVKIKSKPIELYRALRRINPSPYTFYFRHENMHLVGGSPEILIRMEDDHVTYRPIAGTRRRGYTPEEDKFFEKELVGDPKEQAEHVMLVDLGRNDVGRVCKFHSVEVTDLMYVERYSHVMHMVSNVVGDMEDGYDGYDLMRVTFPAGTVTGSPKIRAMEIIEGLEQTKRGPYAGALGYFGLDGDLDFCITLRTILVVDDTAYFQASAGIVADSDRELEYKEWQNKSRAMLRAIEMAEQYQE